MPARRTNQRWRVAMQILHALRQRRAEPKRCLASERFAAVAHKGIEGAVRGVVQADAEVLRVEHGGDEHDDARMPESRMHIELPQVSARSGA